LKISGAGCRSGARLSAALPGGERVSARTGDGAHAQGRALFARRSGPLRGSAPVRCWARRRRPRAADAGAPRFAMPGRSPHRINRGGHRCAECAQRGRAVCARSAHLHVAPCAARRGRTLPPASQGGIQGGTMRDAAGAAARSVPGPPLRGAGGWLEHARGARACGDDMNAGSRKRRFSASANRFSRYVRAGCGTGVRRGPN
jgi:hypothetical protein